MQKRVNRMLDSPGYCDAYQTAAKQPKSRRGTGVRQQLNTRESGVQHEAARMRCATKQGKHLISTSEAGADAPALTINAAHAIMSNTVKWASIIAFSILLGACNSNPPKEATLDPVLNSIENSAKRVSEAMLLVSQVEYASAKKKPRIAKAHRWKGVLAKKVAVPSGVYTLEAIVDEVARKVGYRMHTTGTPPANPVTVIVDARDAPVGDILENIGWQAGNSVGVLVDEAQKAVKIVYEGHK